MSRTHMQMGLRPGRRYNDFHCPQSPGLSRRQGTPSPNAHDMTDPVMELHSSSGSQDSRFMHSSLEPTEDGFTNTTTHGCHQLFQSIPMADSSCPPKVPSFGSGTETSPSLSSSFDFMDAPKEEPMACRLPLQTSNLMNHTPATAFAFQNRNTQFAGSSNIDTSFPWTMGNDVEAWHHQYLPDKQTGLMWSAPMTMPPSWPTFADITLGGTDAPAVLAYDLAPNTSISPLQQYTPIKASSPPIPIDQHLAPSAPKPIVDIGHSQPQAVQPSYSVDHGLPSTQEPRTLTLTHSPKPSDQEHGNPPTHPDPVYAQDNNPAIKASLYYSDTRNALLIEWKRQGLSYKDIKRIGGFKEAESTLRGRFRTLTKAKEQRVRKPKWLARDIQLLCEAVAACTEPSPAPNTAYMPPVQASVALAMAGKPPKVSWKKVAQYIWSQGGRTSLGMRRARRSGVRFMVSSFDLWVIGVVYGVVVCC
ncbi:uncharacterized protein N7482_008937 [Penicillium canariense]|uniref:Uncharacterized protein n=1 Tax=Penicillium canariense TaxID=189055 RepID=A0A9W9HWU7_9EURO|nr:uncharacterized protein N7482_008937 [Penicillium canariense]KAJ5157837.1 hypothetical protein N7482_008937 [Penicillium canariense]